MSEADPSVISNSSSGASNALSAPVATQAPLEHGRTLTLASLQRAIDVPARWLLLGLGLWVLYRTGDDWTRGFWVVSLGAYALVALAATVFWFTRTRSEARASHNGLQPAPKADPTAATVSYALYVVDALFVGVLIWRDGGLASPLYILLALLAVKAVALAPMLAGMLWLPFMFGPLYAAALWLASGSAGFLADPGFLSRYVLLWVWLLGAVLIGLDLARRTRQAVALEAALGRQQAALALQTDVLQRTATDLGDRLLELRALQEVAKALATTLRTEETLQLVVERLASATGSSHCAVALIEPPYAEDASAGIAGENDEANRSGTVLAGALFSDEMVEPALFRLLPEQEPATFEACGDLSVPASGSSRPIKVAP
ncbi:MAG: hypothetical protein ACM30E_10355, partial [Nitrososphaerales archaeon]